MFWGNPQSDGTGGRTFDDAVEISVRWGDKQQKFIDAQGHEQISRAIIYADTDLAVGGYLYLGTLAALSSADEGDPLSVSTAYEIRATSKSPDLKADRFVRKVWL